MDGLWTFPLNLTGNLLGSINCYVVKGNNGGKNLLIDTGMDQALLDEQCRRLQIDAGNVSGQYSLPSVLDAMNLRPENTDVFLTHLHSDHSGNAVALQKMGYRIFMSRTAYEKEAGQYRFDSDRLRQEGVDLPADAICSLANLISGNNCSFTCETVDEGDLLHYGNYSFVCISTPGHALGHMCLYDQASKTMVLGDHVLFDAIPSIVTCCEMKNPLAAYFDSLKKISTYDVLNTLPAHGEITGNLKKRSNELRAYHEEKLNQLLRTATETSNLNGYHLSIRLCCERSGRSWEHVSNIQKYFALEKGFVYLDYLTETGALSRKQDKGISTYFVR